MMELLSASFVLWGLPLEKLNSPEKIHSRQILRVGRPLVLSESPNTTFQTSHERH